MQIQLHKLHLGNAYGRLLKKIVGGYEWYSSA